MAEWIRYPSIDGSQSGWATAPNNLMDAFLPRMWKSLYRKEPISSFILIVGLVDAVMGGVGERWTLLGFGVMLIMVGIVTRFLQTQKQGSVAPPEEQRARRYLPPSPSPQPLPPLSSKKRRSPY